MRKDISKVICEKERSRSRDSYHDQRNTKEENPRLGFTAWPFQGESASPYPFKESMKKKFGNKYAYKSLNDFLAPIEGFLRKAVGRKWDDVYSELSKNIPKSKWLNQHVWTHIDGYVEKNTAWIDGRVCVSDERTREWVPIEKNHYWRRTSYYVHPLTGIMLEIDRTKQRKEQALREKQAAYERWSQLRELRTTKTARFFAVKIKNVWYEVEVKEKPAKIMKFYKELDGSYKKDPKTGALLFYWERPYFREDCLHGDVKHRPPTGEDTYMASKRTLSHSELKRYKLI